MIRIMTEEQFEAQEAKEETAYQFMTWLKETRKSHGITQKYLAKMSGIRQGYISDLESGKRNPSLQNAAKIAKVMDYELIFKRLDFD